MRLIDRLELAAPDALAAIDDRGDSITYADLIGRADRLAGAMPGDKRLVLLECAATIDWLVAYVACLRSGHACLLLPAAAPEMRDRLAATFAPGFELLAADGYAPRALPDATAALHPDLSTLLSTSGSTGSAKCVRLSAGAMAANAAAIAEYLAIGPDERGLVNLPTHYSYGLSIVNSHLHAGAALLFTELSVIDHGLWEFARQARATSFAGVPHSYDLLERVGFPEVAPPSLRYFTQAGGKLAPAGVERFGRIARERGWRFVVMYGQTEAAPRMAWLPPDQAIAHPQAIGVAVPGGELSVEDADGAPLPDETVGELVYRGPNVMMGYALAAGDLALGSGPAELRTGDLARRGRDGLFTIVGRLSRFIKVFGNRIGLDEVERICADAGHRCVASGIDERLLVVARGDTGDCGAREAVRDLVTAALKLPRHSVEVRVMAEFPLLASGKVDYAALKASIAPAAPDPAGPMPVAEALVDGEDDLDHREIEIARIWRDALGVDKVGRDDTFFDVGGDSLSAINVMLRMERAGVPAAISQQIFEGRTIAEIAAGLDREGDRRGGEEPRAPAKRVETNDAITMTRAVLVLLVIAAHWAPFVLVRMGALSAPLLMLTYPVFRFGTPGFAMMYGLGLTFFNLVIIERNPARFAANRRVSLLILGVGVALLAVAHGLDNYFEGVPVSPSSTLYGVLTVYFLLVAASPLVLRFLLRCDWPILGALLLAGASLIVSSLARERWDTAQTSGVVDLARLLIVAKYGFPQMLGYAAIGMALGLWIDGARESPHLARQALLAGIAMIELAALLTVSFRVERTWFVGGAGTQMIIAYCGAVLLIFSGLLTAIRRGVFRGALKLPGRLLMMTGMLAFAAYVGHELALQAHGAMSASGINYALSLAVSVGLFVIGMAVAMRRLYRLYYGG